MIKKTILLMDTDIYECLITVIGSVMEKEETVIGSVGTEEGVHQ